MLVFKTISAENKDRIQAKACEMMERLGRGETGECVREKSTEDLEEKLLSMCQHWQDILKCGPMVASCVKDKVKEIAAAVNQSIAGSVSQKPFCELSRETQEKIVADVVRQFDECVNLASGFPKVFLARAWSNYKKRADEVNILLSSTPTPCH